MDKAMGSFLYDDKGEIITPAPYVRLLKDRRDFTLFLSDGTLFFDGRFAFYEKYERGDFFKDNDLVALILRGEHELVSVTDAGARWEIAVKHTKGEEHALYFIPVPKDESKREAVLK